jgi:hypothetical protein
MTQPPPQKKKKKKKEKKEKKAKPIERKSFVEVERKRAP